jgi:hypothetical protein
MKSCRYVSHHGTLSAYMHTWGGDSSTAISSTAHFIDSVNSSTGLQVDISLTVSTHLQDQFIDRAMLGANSLTACMKLGFQEPPLVAPVLSLRDPTVWLDGARPANTCITPSFP